jgi:EF hand
MKKLIICAGVALLAAGGAALAQDQASRPDRNADTTRAEAVAEAEQRFERLDLDRDGNLSRAEFDQARGSRHGPRDESRGDQQRPGEGARANRIFGGQDVITRAQFVARAAERFDRIDSDRDGIVTAAERQQAWAQMRRRLQERRDREQ